MKKNLIYAAVAALCMVGCSTAESDAPSAALPTTDGAVSFTSTIEGTRVTKSAFAEGETISVTALSEDALITDVSEWFGVDDEPTNITYTYNNSGSFEGSIVKLDELSWSYVALYPAATVSDFEDYSFTVESDQSDEEGFAASDLLIGSADATDNASPELSFKHAMAMIALTIDYDNPNIAEANQAFEDATFTADTQASFDLLGSNDVVSSDDSDITPYLSGGVYYVIIAPQTIAENDDFFTITIDGVEYVWTMDESKEFVSGTQYNYSWDIDVALGTSTITLDSKITEWSTASLNTSALLSKDGFAALSLLGDAVTYNPDTEETTTPASYGPIYCAWDGNYSSVTDSGNGANGYHSNGGVDNYQTASFDLGAEYVLTDYAFWQRRVGFFYASHNVKVFNMYGAAALAGDADLTSQTEGYNNVTGSTTPDFASMTDKWIPLLINATVDETDVVVDGHHFAISESTPVRYIRIQFIESWGSTSAVIGEFDFWGVKQTVE